MSDLFNQQDIDQFRARGIALEQAETQIETFRQGFSFSRLQRPCTKGDGIKVLGERDAERLGKISSQAAGSGRVMKFVPASGAASRMFQALLSARDTAGDDVILDEKANSDVKEFFQHLRDYAFYDDLKSVMRSSGRDLENLISKHQYREVLDYVLSDKGLDYGHLCKGLIKFHRYPDHCRTPFEEHLAEAVAYAQDKNQLARVHFTVPPDQVDTIKKHLDGARDGFASLGVRFEIGLSVQKPSTDTLAVTLENEPFRDSEGRLVFRPGGHGALLANLQELNGDIVFIKNIDNVVPDELKGETYKYKKALGGLLVEVQERAFHYLSQLRRERVPDSLLKEAFDFASAELSIVPNKEVSVGSKKKKIEFLYGKLNRPLRVCGMVKSMGEPGGGPFWVGEDNRTAYPQIVESSQVNMEASGQRAIWNSSTHFNPVDLVCGLRDFEGKAFDLEKYHDPSACFISTKSMDGKSLKALELPGLWNGSMAFWNTIFVEVPLITFNPVKTFLDLLKPAHVTG